jgi:hypothetical protein
MSATSIQNRNKEKITRDQFIQKRLSYQLFLVLKCLVINDGQIEKVKYSQLIQ